MFAAVSICLSQAPEFNKRITHSEITRYNCLQHDS